MSYTRVHRWRNGLVGALLLVAVGLLYAEPLLLAATVLPLTYVAYGALSAVPADAALRVERAFASAAPAPGDRASVTLTVENTGDATLTDLRIIDGVPDELAVVDGSPRGAFALRPGESATVSYTVVAKRGEYAFDDPVVRMRGISGTQRRTHVVDAAGDETLSCVHPLEDAPVRNTTLLRAGTHPTDTGGSGLEFHATREYQPGDPMNRIHWRQYAKTNELTTVSFREERAVRTVLIVDARPIGRVTPRRGNPTGTELCGYAGERLFEALRSADVKTSVTAVGLDVSDVAMPLPSDVLPWAEADGDPDSGTIPAAVLFDGVAEAGTNGSPPTGRISERPLQSDPSTGDPDAGTTIPPSGDRDASADGGQDPTDAVLARLPPTAQVVLVTPLLDDWPVSLARRLEELGYPLTLVSPDVTSGGSLGQTVRSVERRLRLDTIERAGGTTISWQLSRPIDVALSESLAHILSS